jgi:hypothetical protein
MFREEDPAAIPGDVKSLYGVTPASVMWFDSWASGQAFPVDAAKTLWRHGIMPHYTWEPWNTALSPTDPGQIHLADIIDGSWDGYIKARAAEFASVRLPILVRWGHEFNGNWYPWGIANNNDDPSLYVQAYRHVHDLVWRRAPETCSGCGHSTTARHPTRPTTIRPLPTPVTTTSTGSVSMDTTGASGRRGIRPGIIGRASIRLSPPRTRKLVPLLRNGR